MELTDIVGEQGRVCTVLAGKLVEFIWSLSSRTESCEGLQQVQLVTFCRLAMQVLEQFLGREGGRDEEEWATRVLVKFCPNTLEVSRLSMMRSALLFAWAIFMLLEGSTTPRG